MNINAATVSGGLPGGLPAEAAGAAGVGAAATASIVALAVVGAVAGFLNTYHGPKAMNFIAPGAPVQPVKSSDFAGIDWATVAHDLQESATQMRNAAHVFAMPSKTPTVAKHIAATGAAHDKETSAAITALKSKQSTDIEAMKARIGDGLAKDEQAARTAGLLTAGAVRNSESGIIAAIHGIPAPRLTVNVSPTTINRTTQITNRYGPVSGSRNQNHGALERDP